ncbi:MAG TPA: hypothetical protein VEY09_07050 [Pyrinomonadaceae bacterium]|nr:hypothetical protein [Pyrinomonadaceae bacterium]
MSEERDDSPNRPELRETRGGFPPGLKRAAIYLGIGLAVFLLGLVPMWLRARDNAAQRDAARRELRVSRMQNALATAAVDAQRGEYEPARQAASEFFTALREQADSGGVDAALTPAQRDGLRPLLAQRDDLITLLARSDPAAAPRLLDMHAAFRRVVRPQAPEGARTP